MYTALDFGLYLPTYKYNQDKPHNHFEHDYYHCRLSLLVSSQCYSALSRLKLPYVCNTLRSSLPTPCENEASCTQAGIQ